jgi:hypothetical protein
VTAADIHLEEPPRRLQGDPTCEAFVISYVTYDGVTQSLGNLR